MQILTSETKFCLNSIAGTSPWSRWGLSALSEAMVRDAPVVSVVTQIWTIAYQSVGGKQRNLERERV